jgi:hypothetical protein
MESLVVNYGVELAIYSKKTSKFMRYDPESRKVKADSIHPFLKVGRSQKANSRETGTVCLEEFTIYNEKDPSIRGPLTYGSHVYLINK